MSQSSKAPIRTYGSKPRKVSTTHLWDGTRDVPRRPVLGENTNEVNEKKPAGGIGGFMKGVVEWLSPKKARGPAGRLGAGKENKLSRRQARLSLSDDDDDTNTSIASAATLIASTPKKEDKVTPEPKSGLDLLLTFCVNPEVLVFSDYIDGLLEEAEIEKLGEASYSEVFTLKHKDGTTSVLKIVPFAENTGEEKNTSSSHLDDILQEIRISRAMTEIDGFAKFNGYRVLGMSL
jgi:hypothetical protein